MVTTVTSKFSVLENVNAFPHLQLFIVLFKPGLGGVDANVYRARSVSQNPISAAAWPGVGGSVSLL